MLHASYPHQRMLLNSKKRKPGKPLSQLSMDITSERIVAYDEYVKNLLAALTANDIVEMARVLNAYMDYAKAYEFAVGSIYPTRTKYYSSILEELLVHIVKSALEAHIQVSPALMTKDFHIGCCDCVVRFGAGADGEFFQESKMIDFAVALKNTSLPGKTLYVPLLGLEVKRYLDKTMFHTVEHTVRVLADFRPKTYYGFLIEDEARAKDVVANSSMYSREFVLTSSVRPSDSARNPIEVARLQHLVTTIRAAAIAAVDSTVV